MKRLLTLCVVLALSCALVAQSHRIPAEDTNNTFTGRNTFLGPVSINGADLPPCVNDGEVWTWNGSSWYCNIPSGGTGGSVPDATTLIKGKIQLAGDLSGTAAAPTVPGLADKVPTSRTVAGKALTSDVTIASTDLSNGANVPARSPSTANLVPVTNGTSFSWALLPSCSNATTSKLLYNNATQSFSCGTDQGATAWGSITGTLSAQGDLVTALAAKVTATSAVYPASGTIATTSSNVASATALAANGSNCSTGQAASGVDASGNAESCTTYLQTQANADWTAISGAAQILNKPTIPTSASWPGAGTCNNLVVTGINNGSAPTCAGVPAAALPPPSAIAFGGVQSKICTGTDKLSAIGNDGVPVCSADQTGAGGSGITSMNGVTLGTQTFVGGSNITITSDGTGGSHSFAFTGICSKARGCTGADNTAVTFPSSGTVATTAQLPSTKAQVAGQWLNAYDSATETFTASAPVKADVGLGNVDNTSDLNKPISTATQTALDLKAPLASPTFTGTVSGVSKAMVGLGNVDNTSDANKPVSTSQQTALNLKANLASPTFTGTVSGITAAMVGLGNVNNTSDANKPVSTAQQTALDLKANLASPTFTGTVAGITKAMVGLGNVDNTADASKPVSTATQAALDLKAPIANPTFTGTLTAPVIQSNATTDQSIELPNATSPTVSSSSAAKLLVQSNKLMVSENTAAAVEVAKVTSNITGTAAGITGKTLQGTGTVIPTVTGSATANKQLTFDANGNVVASTYDVGTAGSGVVGLSANFVTIATSPTTLGASKIKQSESGKTMTVGAAGDPSYLSGKEAAAAAGKCDGEGTNCASDEWTLSVNSTTHKLKCELGASGTDCMPTATLPSQPWGVSSRYVGMPASSTVLFDMLIATYSPAVTITIPSGCSGSILKSATSTNATGTATFTLSKNGSAICTFTTAAGSATTTPSGTGGTLTSTDELKLIYNTADATFSDPIWVIAGTR